MEILRSSYFVIILWSFLVLSLSKYVKCNYNNFKPSVRFSSYFTNGSIVDNTSLTDCGSCEIQRYGFIQEYFTESSKKIYHISKNITYITKKSYPTSYDVVKLWENFPKVLVPRNTINEKCRKESQKYLEALKKYELWALRIFDSTAKLPSGILSGNINQFGDFDECLSAIEDTEDGGGDTSVRGKYCLAAVKLETRTILALHEVDSLLHAHHIMNSNLTDLGHRIPRFSDITWGVCMPSSCLASDLEQELRSVFRSLPAEIKVSESMCSTLVSGKSNDMGIGEYLTMALFLLLVTLNFLGSILDILNISTSYEAVENVLKSFSLKKNWANLVDKSGAGNLKGVDGVRATNAVALLLAHKTMAMLYNPYVNRKQMAEIITMPWAVIGRAAILYTDTFLFLSGLLNARSLLRDLALQGTMDFKRKLIARVFRLLPLMTSVILFSTYILPKLNSGPQWPLVVEQHAAICRSSMWKNFLFIHNIFGFEEMCLTHTHQVGIDMQLFLVTPPIVWLLYKKPRLGLCVTLLVAAVSTALRWEAVFEKRMSMFIFYGMSVQNFFDAAKYSYVIPHHRATIYFFGVALAYFMTTKYNKTYLDKVPITLIWVISIGTGLYTQLSWWKMGMRSYVYEPKDAALFAAFSPISWGLFLALAHWAMFNERGGWFANFMSWRGWQLFSKIAYSVYLTQFPIFFYNVGSQRNSDYYKSIMMFYLPEILAIITVSIVTTLTIEMPFIELHKRFLAHPRGPREKLSKENSNSVKTLK